MPPEVPTNQANKEVTVFSRKDLESAANPPPADKSPNSSMSDKDLRSMAEILNDIQDAKTRSDSDAGTLVGEDNGHSSKPGTVVAPGTEQPEPKPKSKMAAIFNAVREKATSFFQGVGRHAYRVGSWVVTIPMLALPFLALAKLFSPMQKLLSTSARR